MANRILEPEFVGGDGTVSSRRTSNEASPHETAEYGATFGSVEGERRILGFANGNVLLGMVLAVWLAVIVILGANRAFLVPPGTPPYPIAIAVAAPIAVFLAALWLSAGFRSFVSSVNLPLITAIQGWRWAGLGFIFLSIYGVLPGAFAWPAGIGDMAIALTAPWVALALVCRRGFATSPLFVAWNVLGILDHVVSVSDAAIIQRLASGAFGEITVAPMAVLPLVLIPAFLVPFFDMLHLVALFQVRQLLNRSAKAA